ncbi:hypothetical protein [Sphingomonas sp.]|uniref:hypothetical protein n=1 Tax=Sphingomonas sp. TaxID=28214 RepID=UPI001B01F28B|nr:hypothetical protein [Sphingomonas sp.]MBO9714963.1 hypothetical protein [Sphingomonas sp.]
MSNQSVLLRPRAALLIGAALLSTPAFAQDAQQTVTPPPVVPTVSVPAPAPAPAPERVITFAPQTETVQPVQQAVPEAAPARTATSRTTTTTTTRRVQPEPAARRTTTTTTRTEAPAEAAPAAEPQAAPAPVAEAPAPAPVAAEPATAAETTTTTTETTPPTQSRSPMALIALLALIVLAGAGAVFLLLRRRSRDEIEPMPVTTYADPIAARPAPEPIIVSREPERVQPLVEPVAEAPLASEAAEPLHPIETEAHAHEADKEDLAALAGAAPVAHRPWLELGIRPVRAGTTEEEAAVEFELTIGNSGDLPAEDVHVTTFMLADAEGSEMEQMLLDHQGEDSVPPVTIAPGEGTRIDATLAAPKEGLGRVFNPVVVADARYRLPDGSEGRTAAAFRIGRPSPEEGLGPIGATRPHFVDDVSAELDHVLERA